MQAMVFELFYIIRKFLEILGISHFSKNFDDTAFYLQDNRDITKSFILVLYKWDKSFHNKGVSMVKGKCIICKIIGILAIIGALNWGSIGIGTGNFVEAILGTGGLTKIIYILVGLSGVAMLIMCVKPCPCKKE